MNENTSAPTVEVPAGHVDGHPIEVRKPRFEWEDTPVHWVPDDPMASHVGNALHLLFPMGERFFIEALRSAADDVRSEELRAAIKPFIGQEAWHARAHDVVLDHLEQLGIDPGPYLKRLDRFFDLVLRDRENWPGWLRRRHLHHRLAVTAAIEHFTAVLGDWMLRNEGLEAAGADPVMLDLFRWHAAEEVEHRALVYDVYQEVSGSYPLRAVTMVGTAFGLLAAWELGIRYFLAQDPSLEGRRPGWRQRRRVIRQGRGPSRRMMLASVLRYLRRDHHPSQECSTELALAYLQTSPALHQAA